MTVTFIFILAGLFAGCTTDTDDERNPEATSPAAVITIVSGNNQTARGGEQLVEPVIVKVTNSTQMPIENTAVYFEIVEGDGRIVTESTTSTDADGLAEVRWIIGSSYNAIEVSISEELYEARPCYIYAEGDNPTGMSIARTINSLERVGTNFYTIRFHGDYSDILENVNQRFMGNLAAQESGDSQSINYYCSLFSAFGNPNAYIFGRSFDNLPGPDYLTILGRYNPPDGYASIALARMSDFGYERNTTFEYLSFSQKTRLLEAAFFPPDGINEHGLVVGLASVGGPQYESHYVPDENKKTIFITLLVRELLDHAKNVDEAAELALSYNVFHPRVRTQECHVLVADPSGRSIILELYDGELKVIPSTGAWQVLTNSQVYNISIIEQIYACTRFSTVYHALENAAGNITPDEGMNILDSVGVRTGTQWSALYNMTAREILLCIDCDFANPYHFAFD